MGRRMCPSCNRNYNLTHIERDGYYMRAILPTKKVTHCDACEVPLVVRDDDKESIINERHELYMEKTLPILDYYRQRTTVVDIEAK